MSYIDGFVAAVPTANREAYRRHAEAAAAVFKEHGATHIYTRLNVGGAARAQELEDMVAGLHPVMNSAHAS